MASSLAARPGGTVTQVFSGAAEREGAYRFLESGAFETRAMVHARDVASVQRCASESRVFVAVDASSLALSNRLAARDVGGVGAWKRGGQGLHVVTALAVSSRGAPIDVCGQVYWARKTRSVLLAKNDPRESERSETAHVVKLVGDVLDGFATHAPQTQPWLQFDRGYDGQLVLKTLLGRNALFTVRASHPRRLVGPDKRSVTDALREAPVLGQRVLRIPRRGGAPARTATLDVKSVRVDVALPVTQSRRVAATLTVVQAHEAAPPAGVEPLSWTLLTSAVVGGLNDADVVIEGYAMRWRIEELHRMWKSGLCHVEDTQLRLRDALVRWATLTCAVAARAQRLTHLARETPDVLASTEFSRVEIDAVIVLKSEGKSIGVPLGADPPLANVVRWVADLGGYTGKSSGGPPGAIVIGRGLDRIEAVATALNVLRRGDL